MRAQSQKGKGKSEPRVQKEKKMIGLNEYPIGSGAPPNEVAKQFPNGAP